jgi:hypothetical protein
MQDHPVQHLLQAHGGRLPQAPHRKEAGQNTQGLQEGWRSSSKTKRIVKKSMINFQYVLFLLHHGLYLRLPMQADRQTGHTSGVGGCEGAQWPSSPSADSAAAATRRGLLFVREILPVFLLAQPPPPHCVSSPTPPPPPKL